MITPIEASSRARSKAWESSKRVAGRKALRTSGRQMVIRAMPPAVSYRMSSKAAGIVQSTSNHSQSAHSHCCASVADMRVGPSPGDLVAVALPPGPAWAEQVARCWEAGAALLPVDHRLPAAAAAGRCWSAPGPPCSSTARAGAGSTGTATDPEWRSVVATSGSSGEPRLVELDRAARDRRGRGLGGGARGGRGRAAG